MRNIRISDEVWQAIANQGKFGETEDDVLRRFFKLPVNSVHTGNQTNIPSGVRLPNRVSSGRRRSFAAQRMTSFINDSDTELHIEFQDGESSFWSLPKRNDKAGIRTLLNKAIEFAQKNKASLGQINAVRKTLTSSNYHITK